MPHLSGPISVMVKNMKKSTLGYIFFGLVVVSVGGTVCCWVYGGDTCTSNMTNLIYSLTLVAVVFYTNETIKLREQNQMGMRPIVVPYPVPEKISDSTQSNEKKNGVSISHFSVRNVKENGFALNIYLLVWDTKQFKISKPEVTPRILSFNDKFDFTDDTLEACDATGIKKLLPHASTLVDTIQKENKHAVCCIYSDLDNGGYYIIEYGMTPGNVYENVDPGSFKFGELPPPPKKPWFKFW